MTSSRLYSAVTKHWPRIAAGLVVAIGIVEFLVGGVTSDSELELYVFAWATISGGAWFLFDRAERALSDESRARMVGWLQAADLGATIESLPAQFTTLFDRVMGERHLSLRRLGRSSVASVAAVTIVSSLWLASEWSRPHEIWACSVPVFPAGAMRCDAETIRPLWPYSNMQPFADDVVPELIGHESFSVAGLLSSGGLLVLLVGLFNLIPDFLSLVESRVLVGWARRSRLLLWAVIDVVFTGLISLSSMYLVLLCVFGTNPLGGLPQYDLGHLFRQTVTLDQMVGSFKLPMDLTTEAYLPEASLNAPVEPVSFPPGIFFYSAFFTSVWLWLYAASVLLSRVLLRMNSGVGFLLRVTDVENQPFRSMGFVSVLIVSVLFALGLPLVLL